MEAESLPQREEEEVGDAPKACSPLIVVESTPMEVAMEEPHDRE